MEFRLSMEFQLVRPECNSCPHRQRLECGSDYCGYTPDDAADPENTMAAEHIHDMVESGADPANFRLPTTGCLESCPLLSGQ